MVIFLVSFLKNVTPILVSTSALSSLDGTLLSSLSACDEIPPARGLADTEMPIDIRWVLTDLLKPLCDPPSVWAWRYKTKLAEILLQSDSLSTTGKAETFRKSCVIKRKQCRYLRGKAQGLFHHKSVELITAVSGSGKKLCIHSGKTNLCCCCCFFVLEV